MDIDFSKYDQTKPVKGEYHYLRFDSETWNELTEFFGTSSPTSIRLRLLGWIRDINAGNYVITRKK